MRFPPFVFLDQVVELDHVDRVDPHSLEALFERRPCSRSAATAGFGREENVVSVILKVVVEVVFAGSVAGRRVEMVYAGGADLLDCGVSSFLAHSTERRRAKDDSTAVVTS